MTQGGGDAAGVLFSVGRMTDQLDEVRRNLVIANRVLADEGILDAGGHISARHPDDPRRFILSRARAPEIVELDDLMEFGMDGEPLQSHEKGSPYLERYIHAAIYERRPEVQSICHNHAPSILPFSISKTAKLRPVIHTAALLGKETPVWDIADEFGADTNMLVVNMDQGRSLAQALGESICVLMRGHGSVVTGSSVQAAVAGSLNMDKNARVQLHAMQLGEYIPLSSGEVRRPNLLTDRGWEAYAKRFKDRV